MDWTIHHLDKIFTAITCQFIADSVSIHQHIHQSHATIVHPSTSLLSGLNLIFRSAGLVLSGMFEIVLWVDGAFIVSCQSLLSAALWGSANAQAVKWAIGSLPRTGFCALLCSVELWRSSRACSWASSAHIASGALKDGASQKRRMKWEYGRSALTYGATFRSMMISKSLISRVCVPLSMCPSIELRFCKLLGSSGLLLMLEPTILGDLSW